MKVVLFRSGLGTRIRDCSETIPKPMMPIGRQPILLHIMQYYSHFGHRDFILCLGYKANVIKDHFLNLNPAAYGDCIISEFGKKLEAIGERLPDWKITLVDTGIWRNIGERPRAVRHLLQNEEIFLANCTDGLTDVFVAVPPLFNFHLAESDEEGTVRGQEFDFWINGRYFASRNEIFDHMADGEELALEPFNRLIESEQPMACRGDGFLRIMGRLRDKQILENMVKKVRMPWRFDPQTGEKAA
jgi:glucose-1-phosphate cytidylyltransferase